MRLEPRPTRAEVTDAAYAVSEGVDAIMLAGETAVGSFPVRTVQTLATIISEAELGPSPERIEPLVDATGTAHGRALCEAAVLLASTGRAEAIVAVTREGKTARMLAALRPRTPIIAATAEPKVAGRLAVLRGVIPLVTPERDVERLERILVQKRMVDAPAVVVFINVSPDLTRPDANFLNVQRVS
jgi:pyruvate kinase